MGRHAGAFPTTLCVAGLLAGPQVCATQTESYSRVVEPVFPRPNGDISCPCQDPLGSGTCYEPVCPAGYFRCCVNCHQSPCFGSDRMELSFRGIPECILCKTGDFCDGCDGFRLCPDNDSPGREGPRISAPGSTRFNDCESCPPEKEASFDRSICMFKYSHVCSKDFVNRCINNCWAADPQRGKNLTACELMKCTMYCSKQWSEKCMQAVGQHCRYMLSGVDTIGSLLPNQPPAQARLMNCDVDCNGAPRAALAVLAAIAASATWALA